MIAKNLIVMSNTLKPSALLYEAQRSIGMVNKQRKLRGQVPRRADDKLFEAPEFSFVDGRGAAPLTLGQRRRYLRNMYHCQVIIKHLKQFQEAKKLVPDPLKPPEYAMQEHPRKLDRNPHRPRTLPV